MFNLEKCIADWRKQMLDAGIQTPVPLEELEIHLRDEIERQMKSGLDEQSAIEISAQQIGQPKTLNTEFNKGEGQKVKWMITGWLATGVALLYGVTLLYFRWALIGFHPECDLETIAAVFVILAAETGIWFLAKASRNRTSRSAALLICVLLAGIGLFGFFPAEQRHTTYNGNSPIGIVFAEMLSQPSPLWFRGGLTLLLCLPGVFWIWWKQRSVNQERNSTQRYQNV